MNRNILITGATGFLGRELATQLVLSGDNVVGIGHSEKRTYEAGFALDNVPLYCTDLSHDRNQLDHVIKKHEVEYVIHAAAMKHVGLSEENPYRAIEVNVLGSKNVLDLSYANGVKNLIGISTDKAIKPSCTYGCTKMLMERMFLEKNYSICRGVNFLFSDGSVLDIWKGQKNANEPISINKNNTIRFFVDVKDFAGLILDNIDAKGKTLSPKLCYKIPLHDLATAFCELNHYDKTQEHAASNVEKMIEDIPEGIEVIEPSIETIKSLLGN